MDLIQQVGAFAGLAAFIGLTVLALLYFSQARDVRRLREWAGRAPERAAVAEERSVESRPHVEPASQAEPLPPPPPPGRAARRLAEQSPTSYSMRGRSFRDRLPEPRYLALIIGGVIILGAGLAVGASQLLGGDGGGGGSAAHGGKKTAGKVVPGDVEVAVLNGTAVPGLAAKVGDDIRASGFKLGAITNSQASFGNTIVMFERGHEAEAKVVAKNLSVHNVKLMSSAIRGVANGAKVAVIVGQDRATP